jgi:CIC family chloride channel protein
VRPQQKANQARFALVLAAVTGLLTGLAVTLFDWVTSDGVFGLLVRQRHWVQVLGPAVGLLAAVAALRWLAGGASPATADEYVANFHQPGRPLDERPVLGRLVASVATLGFGGAMGYEGPSIYLGAAIGSTIQRRVGRRLSHEEAKLLLVAGAAAGVAAIFKAPATGLIFALEVPYQEDFARRMLLPAGIAAAISYLTFVTFRGTAPLLAVQGTAPFDLRDLGGALVVGALCGIGARLFVSGLRRGKQLSTRFAPVPRALVAGAMLAGLAAAAFGLTGRGLTLGAGYDTLQWALDPRRSVAIVVAILVMRGLATVVTVAGSGVGGLFLPLVVEGALLGRAVSGLFRTAGNGLTLFPLIGVAAFLGAGYRVPLAGVVFVAESTGRPGFVVPGLIAAIVAQLFMGSASASAYQVATRGIIPDGDGGS